MTSAPLGKKKLAWTNHSKYKMRFYGLSEARVRRVINSPKRIEKGIAPKTIAIMQKAGTRKNPSELWVMIEDVKDNRRIISAWRYPGTTKPRSPFVKNLLLDEYESVKT